MLFTTTGSILPQKLIKQELIKMKDTLQQYQTLLISDSDNADTSQKFHKQTSTVRYPINKLTLSQLNNNANNNIFGFK